MYTQKIPTDAEIMNFLEKYVLTQPGRCVKIANIKSIIDSEFGDGTYAKVIGKGVKAWIDSRSFDPGKVLYPFYSDSYDLYVASREPGHKYTVDEFITLCKIILRAMPTGILYNTPGVEKLFFNIFRIASYKVQITDGLELSAYIEKNKSTLEEHFVISNNKITFKTAVTPKPQPKPVSDEKFLSVIAEILEKEILIHFPAFDKTLKKYRPDLANYRVTITNGKSIEDWLKNKYPNHFYCPKDEHYFTIPGIERTTYTEAHHFSVMVQHSSLFDHTDALSKYTGVKKTKLNWSGDISIGFANALLGINDIVCYSVDGVNKIVFETGLSTIKNNPILCVVSENTDTENDPHRYVLVGFCCIAEDALPLCDEIRKYAPSICISTSDKDSFISELYDVRDELVLSRKELTECFDGIKDCIDYGFDINESAVKQISEYHATWEKAKKLILELSPDCEVATINLEYISDFLSSIGENTSAFAKTKELFCNFLTDLIEYFNHAASPVVEKIEKHRKIVNGCTTENYDQFKTIAAHYNDLMTLTEMESPSEDVNLFTTLHIWFEFTLYPLDAFFNKTAADMGIDKKDIPATVGINLSAIERVKNSAKDSDAVEPIDADELFRMVSDGTTSDEMSGIIPHIKTFCTTPLESAVLLGDFAKCKFILSENGDENDYLPVIESLEGKEPTPNLSLFHCGKRISSVFGNEGRLAEKLFISGLMFDSLNCASELLCIYADGQNHDFFSLVFDRYGEILNITDSNVLNFLLEVLCSRGEDALNAYLADNVSVFYHPVCSVALRTLAEQFEFTETQKIIDLISKNYNPTPSESEFETMILNAKTVVEIGALKEYIQENRANLEADGYEVDELYTIVSTNDDLRICSPIVRLYLVQKNKNGTVERLIRDSLFHKRNLSLCNNLIAILDDEERFEELQLVFRCYEEKLSSHLASREFYVRSLFKSPDDKLCDVAHSNMQDVFALYSSGRITDEDLHSVAIFANEAQFDTDLFDVLPKLTEYLSDPLVKSIILISDQLRDYAIDSSMLADFMLPQEQIQNFVYAYRNALFDSGRNILSVGKRLFTFIGCKDDIAKEFILIALNLGYNAFEALRKLYTAENNRDELLNLFSLFPEQSAAYLGEYSNLLFESGDYNTFLSAIGTLEHSTPMSAVQTIIAKANVNYEISGDEFNLISENLHQVASVWVARMAEALAKNGYYTQLGDLLCSIFDSLFVTYSAGEVEEIITAAGTLSPDDLKQIAKHAKDNPALKFYLYENLDVGSAKITSAKYFRELLALYSDVDGDEKELLATKIKAIYAKNTKLITEFILLSVNETLQADGSSTEQIAEILSNITLAKDGVLALLKTLKKNNVTLTAQLSESVMEMCLSAGAENECAALIGSVFSLDIANAQDGLLNTLCSLYTAAIENGTFDLAWCDDAYKLCRKLVHSEEFAYNALFLAYSLSKHVENTHYASFALFMLNKYKFDLPEQIADKVNSVYETSALSSTGNIFDLFADMLESTDADEIKDYVEFCEMFVSVGKGAASLRDTFFEKISTTNPDIYSPEFSSDLLYLLYHDPADASLWQHLLKLPINNTSCSFAKLMYSVCIMARDTKLWKQCLNLCEQCSENLFAKALIAFTKNASNPSTLREFLVQKTNTNHAYLAQLKDEDSQTLASLLIEQMDFYAMQNHSAVRDLASIVIATDSKEAFAMTIERLNQNNAFASAPAIPFAIACQLLLRKRFSEAKDAITYAKQFSLINPYVKYQKLIDDLSAKDDKQLAEWSADPLNQQLLTMILPDGNYPALEVLQHFTFSSNFEQREKALLLCTLLDNKPDDYACLTMLFNLCVQLPDEIPMLHKALCGLVRYPQGSGAPFYSRSRKDYALLLVFLNAYITANNLRGNVSDFDGYDFNIPTAQFFANRLPDSDTIGTEYNAVIEEAEGNVVRLLTNQIGTKRELLLKSCLCYVTGNWSDFLISCFNEENPLANYVSNFPKFKNGFARNVLKAIYALPEEERASFTEWLRANTGDAELPTAEQTETALLLYERGHFGKLPTDVLDCNLLDLPFEETSLGYNIIKMTIDQLETKAPASVYDASCLAIALSRSESVARELRKKADNAFRASNDALAYSYYSAIYGYCLESGIEAYPSANYQIDQRQPINLVARKNNEDIQALTRISGAFSGESDALEKISNPEFHYWSCVNIIFTLLYTNRANEANRLINLLSFENQTFAHAIMRLINPAIPDADKINIINSFKDDIGRVHLCYMMTRSNGETLAFLKDRNNLITIKETYDNIAQSTFKNGKSKYFYQNKQTGTFTPLHWLIIEPLRIKMDLAMAQLDPAELKSADTAVVESGKKSRNAVAALSFVSALQPLDSDESIDDLWNEHEVITYTSPEHCSSKCAISEKLYRIVLSRGASPAELYDYALRFGVDAYHSHLMSREYAHAYNIILEMMSTYDQNNNSVGNRKLSDISDNALHSIFTRGLSTLDELVQLFIKYSDAFHAMKQHLPASANIDTVYSALDIIAVFLKSNSTQNASIFEGKLKEARDILADADSSSVWDDEVISLLSQKVQAALNALDNRPKLTCVIENTSATTASPRLFGFIKNSGKATADNVKIQFLSDSGTLPNDEYFIPRLDAGDTAAFNVGITPNEDMGFDYSLSVTYEHNGDVHSTRFDEYHMDISDEPFVLSTLVEYHTGTTISEYSLNENGEVYSPLLFGRKDETHRIRSLFSNAGFAYYKNALMIGMRRVGKSSLLNYLKSYANLKFEDVLAISYECGGEAQAKQPIQIAFVKRVLDACLPMELQGGKIEKVDRDALTDDLRRWYDFYRAWSIPQDAPDRDPYTLKFFYRELKELNGKGLLLILDEFDTVIGTLEKLGDQQTTVSASLFPALREIINDIDGNNSVHFVICGSTQLIRHFDSGSLTQFVQQIATNPIDVGNLPFDDMKEMITKHCEGTLYKFCDADPDFKGTDGPIMRIWKYTQGLVWYAKLIAQEAVEIATKSRRYTIYSADVVRALHSVSHRENNYSAINHSCHEEVELPLLKAIRVLTAKPSQYVSFDNLAEHFDGRYSRADLEKAVKFLVSAKILECHQHNPNLYRFAVELYWHFFDDQTLNYAKPEKIPEIFSRI